MITNWKLTRMKVRVRFLERVANPHVHPYDLEGLEVWRDELRGQQIHNLPAPLDEISPLIYQIEALLMTSGIKGMEGYA